MRISVPKKKSSQSVFFCAVCDAHHTQRTSITHSAHGLGYSQHNCTRILTFENFFGSISPAHHAMLIYTYNFFLQLASWSRSACGPLRDIYKYIYIIIIIIITMIIIIIIFLIIIMIIYVFFFGSPAHHAARAALTRY